MEEKGKIEPLKGNLSYHDFSVNYVPCQLGTFMEHIDALDLVGVSCKGHVVDSEYCFKQIDVVNKVSLNY